MSAPRLGLGLVALLLVALALGPAIAHGDFWAAGDGLTQNLPHRVIVAASLLAGELPFWNPYAFGGMPFFATIQPGTLFVGNAAFLLLPGPAAMDATVGLAIAGSILGVAAFVRALGLPWLAALLGGVVFGLGGFVTMHVEHVQMIQVAAQVPWLLWAIERHAQAGRARHALLAALLVAGCVLAGSPQLTAYGLLLAAAYAAWRAADPAMQGRLGFLARGALAGGLGVALAACQLLPTLDLIAGTQRGGLGPYAFAFASLPPTGLAGLFAPYLFGVRAPAWPVAAPWWGVPDWQGFLDGYVGMAALLLAGVGLARWKAARQVRFWTVVAGVGVVLALGSFTPAAELVARLPVLNAMRYPYRHFFEVTLAVSVLAAHGLAWLQAGEARRALAVVGGGLVAAGLALVLGLAVGGGALAARLQPHMPAGVDVAAALSPLAPGVWLPLALALAASGLAWGLRATGGRGWAIALVALAALDLLAYGRLQGLAFVLPDRPAALGRAPWPDPAAGRELTVPELRYPNCYQCDMLAHLRKYRYPGVAALDGTATVNGYDAFVPARYGRLLGMDSFGHAGEYDEGRVFGAGHHALDLLGCRTLRVEAEVAAEPAWAARLAGGRYRRGPDTGGFVVLANPRALPPAWRVARARELPADAVDAAVRGEAPFDPAAEALIDLEPFSSAPLAVSGVGGPLSPGPYAPGPATTAWADRTTLAIATDGPGPGLVVVSEGYDPGWRAFLADGSEVAVRRADALLMAVEVPAGPARVLLRYRPRRWAAGVGLSLLAALGLLAWALVAWRRRLPEGGSASSRSPGVPMEPPGI